MEEVIKLNINFTLNKTTDELKAYCAMIYEDLMDENLEDDSFKAALRLFRKSTEGNMYNKFPSVGDILKFSGKKPRTVEQLAQEQCDLVFSLIEKLDRQQQFIFPDKVTNYVLMTYPQGVDNFIWENCKRNENRQELTWRRERFKDSYISAYDSGRQSVAPLELNQNNGRYGSFLVDNRELCIEHIQEHEQNELRLEKSPLKAMTKALFNNNKENR